MRVICQHAFWICVLAALTGAFAADAASAPTTTLPATSPPACSYDIVATLDEDGATMSAVAQITYRNGGPDALEDLVFHFERSQDSQAADLPPPTVRHLGDGTIDLPARTWNGSSTPGSTPTTVWTSLSRMSRRTNVRPNRRR